MTSPTWVNPQIINSVSETNLKVLGTPPAVETNSMVVATENALKNAAESQQETQLDTQLDDAEG